MDKYIFGISLCVCVGFRS